MASQQEVTASSSRSQEIIDQILFLLQNTPDFKTIFNHPSLKTVTGLGGLLPILSGECLLKKAVNGVGFLVVDSLNEVEEVQIKLEFFYRNKIEILPYPEIDELPYQFSPLNKTTTLERLIVRQRLLSTKSSIHPAPPNKPLIIVTTIKAISEKIVGARQFSSGCFTIKTGDIIPPRQMVEKLEELGYQREGEVSRLGEYSLRGEILDIFTPAYHQPVRIYFFADDIEEIKLFDLNSHRTQETIPSLRVYNPFEWSYSDASKEKMIKTADKLINDNTLKEKIYEALRFSRNDFSISCIIQQLDSNLVSIFDYLGDRSDSDDKSIVFWKDRDELKQRFSFWQDKFESVAKLKQISSEAIYTPADQLFHNFFENSTELSLLNHLELHSWHHYQNDETLDLQVKEPPSFKQKLLEAKNHFAHWLDLDPNHHIVLFTTNPLAARKLAQIFQELNPEVIIDEETEEVATSQLSPFSHPRFKIINYHLKGGFTFGSLLVICDYELFGKKPKQVTYTQKTISEVIENFSDLKEEDYVVHINHGIGRYLGLERIKVDNREKDFLKIEFQGTSKLYVPVDQMNLIQKYLSRHGQKVELDRLGGKSWDKVKKRVRKNLEDMAEKLIHLYKKRRDYKVPPCSRDDYFQSEFEASFPFEETVDQIKASEEIKEDLEKDYPMDRLLCADVGFGKTEVALRAIFKTILSGRQALLLAPTTILSIQHYKNIIERFDNFPVSIEMLNRFKNTKETRDIIQRTEQGSVDLLIGTHKVLGKKVAFKKLGLLVIDEEQKFGVKQKEKIKEKYPHVDTLSLSATPIPRTLHMSMSSIRDISIITTPPLNRIPVKTYVVEFKDHIIVDAINREKKRKGQIFFVENRINLLSGIYQYLNKLIPDLKVAVVHGQMEGDQISQLLDQFIEGEYDLLLSTSIIESGIDLHNVNTLIVNNADRFGLTQLYQMKGRVGRSERQGYAYFLIPPDKSISEDAMKRLDALGEYVKLGAGFKIAMRDLEIRGPGNVLGAEQSGNVMAVGFELYTKLLNEAVKHLTQTSQQSLEQDVQSNDEEGDGSKIGELSDQQFFLGTLIELKYHGFIPDSYLSDPGAKLALYKQIASVDSLPALDQLMTVTSERFGKVVPEIEKLFKISHLRIFANQIRVLSIKEKINLIEVELTEHSRVNTQQLFQMVSKGEVSISSQNDQKIHIKITNHSEEKSKLTSFETKVALVESLLLNLGQGVGD